MTTTNNDGGVLVPSVLDLAAIAALVYISSSLFRAACRRITQRAATQKKD